ncbi:alpha/beta hydrolase [Mycolicibacterium fluoranthenivorans]|nr:alpha/beta hydrolase [Mycolicibacterium fluoranthenivorans]
MGNRRALRTLLSATAETVNAANAFRPLTRRGYPAIAVFAFGWPTAENVPLVVGGSALSALRHAVRGDYRSAGGRIALLLKVTSWLVLAVVHRRGVRSRPYFEDPLNEVLGPAFPSVPPRPGGVFATGQTRRRYVEKTVSYGPYRSNVADIWVRPDLPRDGKAPVLLQVPGGAWMIGMNRPQAYPLMSQLADHGWICVSIGYRISPKHAWPAHIVDVKRALAWVKDNIAEYGGDPNSVYITGGSAGGHLCSLAALTPNNPAYQPGFEDADTSVAGAVPIYGRYDWVTESYPDRREFGSVLERMIVKLPFTDNRQLYLDASPIAHVRPDAPPFFVLHGTHDTLIPVEEAREFVEALRAVSTAPVIYAEIPAAQHAFDIFGSARGHYTASAVERFLDWARATRPE